jgi:hypothetical protein
VTQKTSRTVAAAVIAGSLALGSVAVLVPQASAQTATSAPAAATKTRPESISVTLGRLVTAGTITQAQADAVKAAVADAVKAAVKAARSSRSSAGATAPATTTLANRESARRTKYGAIVTPLVTAGTITQAQADAIVSAIATRPDVTSTAADRRGKSRGDKSGTGRAGKRSRSGASTTTVVRS